MFGLYTLLHQYDWGHPFIKLFCFAAAFVLIVFLRGRAQLPDPPPGLVRVERVVWPIVLVCIIVSYGNTYGPEVVHPPRVDIGYTTVNAASMLFNQGKNPYSSQDINRQRELRPQYRGFHYGPLMLLGYWPSVLSPGLGYKLASVTYLLASVFLVCLLASAPKELGAHRLATLTFVLCLFLLSERFWYEILTQGANDVLPVALLLASLLALKGRRYFLTGLMLGLSFAAKFSPAIFLLIALLRRNLQVSIVKGFGLGLLPLLAFALWDPKGVFNNVFWVRFTVPYDSTSLYSEIHPALHFIFPLLLLAAVVYSLYRNSRIPLEYENVLTSFTLLLIVGEVTFRQIHANHLIWFYPLFALTLGMHRYQLFAQRELTPSGSRTPLDRAPS